MPSEDRMLLALDSVARERDDFRSALAAALEQVRGMIAVGNHNEPPPARVAAELGAFASGRIQFERFAEIALPDAKPRKSELISIRHAQQLLTATLALGNALHYADVPENGDLSGTVREALAMAGRAFAAAYAIEVIRTGREYDKEETMLAPLPPERWTRAERAIAPPLVVRVNGSDLRLHGFADLLQGSQKIVLLVDGSAPPAALARLISPSVLVMQCRAPADLSKLAEFDGPAIAAVVEEPAAVFTWNRGVLSVDQLPQEEPKRPLRTATVFRQKEDLAWLRMLAARTPPRTEIEEQDETQPADRLAAWLLKQVELPGS